jgi:chaperonin cofactor prefoldin
VSVSVSVSVCVCVCVVYFYSSVCPSSFSSLPFSLLPSLSFLSPSLSNSLVADTLEKVDPERRCFRLIGGVLVERDVQNVLPNIETNLKQIEKIMEQMVAKLRQVEAAAADMQQKYNIRPANEQEQAQAQAQAQSGAVQSGASGVLV